MNPRVQNGYLKSVGVMCGFCNRGVENPRNYAKLDSYPIRSIMVANGVRFRLEGRGATRPRQRNLPGSALHRILLEVMPSLAQLIGAGNEISPPVPTTSLPGGLSFLYDAQPAFRRVVCIYRAYSTARVSRMTFTRISPGYCISVSIFVAISRANWSAERASIF